MLSGCAMCQPPSTHTYPPLSTPAPLCAVLAVGWIRCRCGCGPGRASFTQASLTHIQPANGRSEVRWSRGGLGGGTHAQAARLTAGARLARARALLGIARIGLRHVAVWVVAVHAVSTELFALPTARAREARLAQIQTVRPAPARPQSSLRVSSALIACLPRSLAVSSAPVPLAASRSGHMRARRLGAGGVEQAM
jgi:hypothetical protein